MVHDMVHEIPAAAIDFSDKARGYRELAQQAQGLLSGERHVIANAANLVALAYLSLPDINWLGFYFMEGGELVVGPFQGKPACVRIPLGQGVCGTAAARREPIVVRDVHAFPGHIACDPASRSEVVVPLLRGNEVVGVLDVDSPHPGRFDETDREGLERLAAIYLDSLQRQLPGG
jgi:L-methionine (R)-S-oxide reductase